MFSLFRHRNQTSRATHDIEAGISLTTIESSQQNPHTHKLYSIDNFNKVQQILISAMTKKDKGYAAIIDTTLLRHRQRKYFDFSVRNLGRFTLLLIALGASSATVYLFYLAIMVDDYEANRNNYMNYLSEQINVMTANWTNSVIMNNPFNVSDYTCQNSCVDSSPDYFLQKFPHPTFVNNSRTCITETLNCTYTWVTSHCSSLWNNLCNTYAAYENTSEKNSFSNGSTVLKLFATGSGVASLYAYYKTYRSIKNMQSDLHLISHNDYLHAGFRRPYQPKTPLKSYLSHDDNQFLQSMFVMLNLSPSLETVADFSKLIQQMEKLKNNYHNNERSHTFLSAADPNNVDTDLSQFFLKDTNRRLRKKIVEMIQGHPLDKLQSELFEKKNKSLAK